MFLAFKNYVSTLKTVLNVLFTVGNHFILRKLAAVIIKLTTNSHSQWLYHDLRIVIKPRTAFYLPQSWYNINLEKRLGLCFVFLNHFPKLI